MASDDFYAVVVFQVVFEGAATIEALLSMH
jgi:hypothetical protein